MSHLVKTTIERKIMHSKVTKTRIEKNIARIFEKKGDVCAKVIVAFEGKYFQGDFAGRKSKNRTVTSVERNLIK